MFYLLSPSFSSLFLCFFFFFDGFAELLYLQYKDTATSIDGAADSRTVLDQVEAIRRRARTEVIRI